MTDEIANAEVVAVYPNKVRVAVDDLLNFQAAGVVCPLKSGPP